VVWWLAPSPHSERIPGSTHGWGLPVHVLPLCAWVVSGYSGFLPPSTNMYFELIGDSNLSLGVSVSVHGCLSHLLLCGPVTDWRPVKGVSYLSSNDSWDRLQPHCDPELD